MKPLRLQPNMFHRFYRGGSGIAELRGVPFDDPCMPEDWIGSTTSLFGCDGPGLSRLEDGRLLRDAVREDPEAFLGPDHIRHWGADPALLVKLLDPDQRLPVHCHPDRPFARKHLGLRYGKTEAWIVVSVRSPYPRVYLGFRSPIDQAQLAEWVSGQRTEALLEAVNTLPVKAGDAFFVPAGIPHAVGPGILIVELQEPTDLSILMEWKDMELDGLKDGHLGLGFATALDAVDRSHWDEKRLADLRGSLDGRSIFPKAADPFFRARQIRGDGDLEAGFSILVVLEGSGELISARHKQAVNRGDTWLVPYAAGDCRLQGPLSAIRCLPALS